MACPSHSAGPRFPSSTHQHLAVTSRAPRWGLSRRVPASLSRSPQLRTSPCHVSYPPPRPRAGQGPSAEQPGGGLSRTEGDVPRWWGPTAPHLGGADDTPHRGGHPLPRRGPPTPPQGGTHGPAPRAQASPALHQLPLSTGPPAGMPFGKDSGDGTKHPNRPSASHLLGLPHPFLSPPPRPVRDCRPGPSLAMARPPSPHTRPPCFRASSSAPQAPTPSWGAILPHFPHKKKLKTPESVQQNWQKNPKQNKKINRKSQNKHQNLPPKTYYQNACFECLKSQTSDKYDILFLPLKNLQKVSHVNGRQATCPHHW